MKPKLLNLDNPRTSVLSLEKNAKIYDKWFLHQQVSKLSIAKVDNRTAIISRKSIIDQIELKLFRVHF